MANNIKKLWGSNLHPVINEISIRLDKLGFDMEPEVDKESGIYSWYSSISSLFELSLSVWPDSYSRNDVTFDVDIGIDSQYFAAIENSLAIWECDPYYNQSGKNKPVLQRLRFLSISLHWLLLNANPPVKRLSWSTAGSSAALCADQLIADFTKYGIPFVEQVDTEEKLLKLLKNINNYPKKTPARGPISADAFCYTALILNECGRKNEALEELSIGLKTELAGIERDWPAGTDIYNESVEMAKCRYSKYSSYIGAS